MKKFKRTHKLILRVVSLILFFILMYPDMGALSVKAETPGTGSDKSALLSEPAATVSQY